VDYSRKEEGTRFIRQAQSDSYCAMLLIESIVDDGEKFIVIERFVEKTERARLRCHSVRGGILASGDDDHLCFGGERTKVSLQFQARHLFHPDVQNDDRDATGLHVVEEGRRFAEGAHRKTIGSEQARDRFKNAGIVVHQTDNLGNAFLARHHEPLHLASRRVQQPNYSQTNLRAGQWTLVPCRFQRAKHRRFATGEQGPARR
jgi:ATP-dependent helicase YprA (DUF1998 family)